MHAALATVATPAFFSEIAVLIVATAIVAYVCQRLGIMPIVSFLLTGALIGPHALGLVRDEVLIEAAAELGVVLLLFTIGIEFSLGQLARIKRLIFIGGGLQVGLVIGLVSGLLALLGVGWPTGIYTGCLVALSSTAIVMKLLMSARDMSSAEGQAALGILIFQDLAVVAMVMLVPMLGGLGGSGWEITLALAKAAAIVAVVVVAARRLVPPLLEAVARTCSQEVFLLSVVAICFGTAFLTSLAGVSLSLGAFLAGLVVSESRFSQLAFGEILPLQILFSASFFVSVGLLFDPGFLVANPLLVPGIIAAVLVIKVVTTGAGLLVLGYGTTAAACSALLLAQVGEFSFVLERTGREMGLFPAGVEAGGPEAFIAATVALMIATPFLYRAGEALRKRSGGKRFDAGSAGVSSGQVAEQDGGRSGHVIIAGFGSRGRALARSVAEQGIPHLILTLSPEGAREAEAMDLQVLRGNYARQHELGLAGVYSARLLVVADDEPEMTHRVLAAARALNPDLPVLALAVDDREGEKLKSAGAEEVISSHRESTARLVARVLERYDVDPAEVRRYQDRMRTQPAAARPGSIQRARESEALDEGNAEMVVTLSQQQRAAAGCSHTDATGEVRTDAQGCEECQKSGDSWVHLRICMTCGHVGCCDSSPNKDATKHFQATGHPIVKSFEPGETWAWCFVDEIVL